MRLVLMALISTLTLPALAANTFTYQGQLQDSHGPYTGSVDLEIRLYDAATGGNPLGVPETLNNVSVTNGLFQAELDFGAQFDGTPRWLEIHVDGQLLQPRQAVHATPVAMYALDGNQGPEGPPGDSHWNRSGTDTYFASGNVGIRTNTTDVPLRVAGIVVTGYMGNQATGTGSFIGGGGGVSFPNEAYGSRSAVVGGVRNIAEGNGSVVTGGQGNLASDLRTAVFGGWDNTANGWDSVVVSGEKNTTNGRRGAVVGGLTNTANGNNSFIGGGANNTASGENSVAFGSGAQALHDNSFVWSDGSAADGLASTGPNQFVVGAAAAVRFYTGKGTASGVELAAGGSGWLSVSDRNAKTAIDPVDPANVLDRVLQMPVSEFSYKSQDESIRHMGPMAQDFHRLFGLGEDELRISPMNLAGISLAAVQGLYARQEAENARLRAEVAMLKAQLDQLRELAEHNIKLEQRLAALESLLTDRTGLSSNQ